MEIKIGRIAQVERVIPNPSVAETAPTLAADGANCAEATEALLRVIPTAGTSTLELRLYTAIWSAGAITWIESVADRVTVPAGEDYTQIYDVGGADRVAVRALNITSGATFHWSIT